ncbi:MAG: aminotransferase class IV [Paludisphaera borealis]|uniref:aminotransferase class IV n=1 Tax=Paludisphaera borealis TaxID=1387353 RepID=UPI002851D6D9|nr:aminotransferase class IV [Paludisphaera borealis]MDR3618879.1 aminotransferase class IV [Paludisphaera borealis]
MIWVEGRIVADDALQISVLDRTFEHGLGLFETLRTWNGRPSLLPRHLDRLKRSAEELRIPLDASQLPTADDVRALLTADGREGDALLRITLSGGISESAGSTLWMRSSPLPAPAPATGLRLGPAGPARNDKLAGYKSLNYWPNRLLHENSRAEGFDECLTVDPTGAVREGSRTNIFFVVGGELMTPPCDGQIVPGIMRGVVVERAAALGIAVEEIGLNLFDRRIQPEEVFLTNAVRGVIPVGSWGDARFPAPGPVTGRIRDDVTAWLESGETT